MIGRRQHSGLPPDRLLRRVGWFFGDENPAEVFEQRGREQWQAITSLVSGDIDLEGKRVLDFGCGVGRILRPAVADRAPRTEFWGCDIDGASVRWLREDLAGRAHVFHNASWPPLDAPDRHFDLIYAFSVFTHLVESWSAWLLELRRVLSDDGIFIATVNGPGLPSFLGRPVTENETGMNAFGLLDPWGPWVAHSEWWLRAHWGRAFDLVALVPGDPEERPPLHDQAAVVMRKRPGEVTAEELERIDPREPRELAALQHNVGQLRGDLARHGTLLQSASWRLTAPLRAGGELARAQAHRLRRVGPRP